MNTVSVGTSPFVVPSPPPVSKKMGAEKVSARSPPKWQKLAGCANKEIRGAQEGFGAPSPNFPNGTGGGARIGKSPLAPEM